MQIFWKRKSSLETVFLCLHKNISRRLSVVGVRLCRQQKNEEFELIVFELALTFLVIAFGAKRSLNPT